MVVTTRPASATICQCYMSIATTRVHSVPHSLHLMSVRQNPSLCSLYAHFTDRKLGCRRDEGTCQRSDGKEVLRIRVQNPGPCKLVLKPRATLFLMATIHINQSISTPLSKCTIFSGPWYTHLENTYSTHPKSCCGPTRACRRKPCMIQPASICLCVGHMLSTRKDDGAGPLR